MQGIQDLLAHLLTIARRIRGERLAFDQALRGGATGPAQQLQRRQVVAGMLVDAQTQAQQRAVAQTVPGRGIEHQAAIVDDQLRRTVGEVCWCLSAAQLAHVVPMLLKRLVQPGQRHAGADQQDIETSHDRLLACGR
ncbi:hypothetical protein D3C77_269520 [compost metagenome]